MDKNVFRLSDNDKCNLLFDALNSTPDSWTMICDIYDDYAIAYDTVARKYIRAYYTKDNETNSVSIDKIEDCYIVDVNEIEMNALNAMKAIGTYSEIQAKLEEQSSQIEIFTADKASLTEQLNEARAKIEEFENQNSKEEPAAEFENKEEEENKENNTDKNSLSEEVQAEIESYKNMIAEKDAEIARLNQLNSDINSEKSELESFKKSVDDEKKTAILDEFSAHLTEEQAENLKSQMENYSVEDFKKEVCFAAYNSTPSLFSKKENEESDWIYKDTDKNTESGALKLLSKHKGGNR